MDVHGDIEGDYEFIRDIPNNATNGEVIQALFPNCLINKTDNWVNIHIDTLTPFSRKWWNAPYKPEKNETCKGCIEPCIMYEADMRACKKKVTEREVSE